MRLKKNNFDYLKMILNLLFFTSIKKEKLSFAEQKIKWLALNMWISKIYPYLLTSNSSDMFLTLLC